MRFLFTILLACFTLSASSQNTWFPKTPLPANGRGYAIGFSIGTKGYIGTGFDVSQYRDLWEWDQATDTWTQKADKPWPGISDAACFVIGTRAYVACGWNGGGLSKSETFRIFDVNGNLIRQSEERESFQLRKNDFAPGVYFISGENTGAFKFIVL